MADLVDNIEKLLSAWKALIPVAIFIAGCSFWFAKTIYDREISTLKTERDAARTENGELRERVKVAAPIAATDDGHLIWSSSLEMEGGPTLGANVFSIRFRGFNKSEREVRLKRGEMISSIDGKAVELKIVAGPEIVSFDEVRPIEPNTPLTLIAIFGPSDPTAPTKVLGIEPKEFAARWRRFTVEIEDNVRKYRIPIGENIMSALLPGLVGPQVLKKN